MYYYDPNNRNPRRWATVATAVYALLLIGSFALVSFDFRQIHDKPGDTITIDFTEPPALEPLHNDPEHAWCDGAESITPETFDHMMGDLRKLAPIVGREI